MFRERPCLKNWCGEGFWKARVLPSAHVCLQTCTREGNHFEFFMTSGRHTETHVHAHSPAPPRTQKSKSLFSRPCEPPTCIQAFRKSLRKGTCSSHAAEYCLRACRKSHPERLTSYCECSLWAAAVLQREPWDRVSLASQGVPSALCSSASLTLPLLLHPGFPPFLVLSSDSEGLL